MLIAPLLGNQLEMHISKDDVLIQKYWARAIALSKSSNQMLPVQPQGCKYPIIPFISPKGSTWNTQWRGFEHFIIHTFLLLLSRSEPRYNGGPPCAYKQGECTGWVTCPLPWWIFFRHFMSTFFTLQ